MAEPNGLSEREHQILVLVASGASNKEIAQQLAISANTVKVHLRNIFAKIGVMSRTEAAMYAVKNGYVPSGQAVGTLASEETNSIPDGETRLSPDFAGNAPTGDVSLERERRGSTRRSYLTYAALLLLVILATASLSRLLSRQATQSPGAGLGSSTDETRWKALEPLPTARYGMAVALYENRIFTIGGNRSQGVADTVETYDTGANRWVALKKKPTAVGDVQAAVIGGRIYVPGGRLADGSVTNALEIYEPRSDQWQPGAALPEGLSAYALAAMEGRLYLFGGWDGSQYVAVAYEYDPAANKWTSLEPMPTGRGFAAAAVAGDRIYLLGGRDATGALKSNEMFNPERGDSPDAWVGMAPMPAGRYGMGAATIAGVIHVLGGESEGAEALAYLEYFPSTDSWKSYPGALSQPIVFPGLISQESYLYMIGGEEAGKPSAQSWVYQAIYSVAVPLIR